LPLAILVAIVAMCLGARTFRNGFPKARRRGSVSKMEKSDRKAAV
jgi:hypothetical protein